ncbi:hypothetical protein TPHA_0A02240 [Tetrapisispora phaffii CBS 4417]|uniref:FAD dependent oxidoreductase domain-containing protein n=1 Tax=Tetrapisispora phaffii (strain ATCC 24235 / CBS 4417 / NBRC 1672 / NRRL Y-8282 / UCD 70-5) TaxID=1071381 RepID=G8BN28_TETPH|nr:hypothetical protein TPHA_0A02240 [Tetrapisispora phaffii CBS 4417]CCE61306.1 hypothetical protein TPHA_0A02240 [Tetrapisispora phaffii CBS 4417]
MSKVLVLGAGVSGLTSALSLIETFPDSIKELTIISSEFPGDYHSHDFASPWAGANWCSFASNSDKYQIIRDKFTYLKFLELSERDPRTQIKKFPVKHIASKEKETPWFIKENFVKDLTKITPEELRERNFDPDKFVGWQFTTVSISPNLYNNFLLSQLKTHNVITKRIQRIEHIEEVIDILGYTPDLVINCSGINGGKILSELDPEEADKVYPVKGQILQIYEDLPFQIMGDDLPTADIPLEDEFLNIFPRPEGGCIVGGIMRANDGSRNEIDGLFDNIERIAKRHVPELQKFTVFNKYVAIRNARKGGVRIEFSNYVMKSHKGNLNVVHNYGIGGSGYQSSFGSAKQVCELSTGVLGKKT